MGEILHRGVVQKTLNGRVWVQIERGSACGACAASKFCTASDSRQESIEITDNSRKWTEGEKVQVRISTSLAGMAVVWVYLIPLLLLLVTLFAVIHFTTNEIYAALASLGVLVVYYGVLYLCNPWLQRKAHFSLTLL